LEKVVITVTSPFEVNYRVSTKDLTLKGVDSRVDGCEYLIQIDPVATRFLAKMLADAEKNTGEPVGEAAQAKTQH
jgi:hypothetical protein